MEKKCDYFIKPIIFNVILKNRLYVKNYVFVGKVEESIKEIFNKLEKNILLSKSDISKIQKVYSNDEIKLWSKKPEVIDAFIEIIFENYSAKVDVPKCMKEEEADFKEDETDESKFNELFSFDGDINFDPEGLDWLSISVIGMLLKKNKINASPQKYKNWLLKKGCAKCKKTKNDGKRVLSWVNIQIYEGVEDDLAQAGCLVDDDDE